MADYTNPEELAGQSAIARQQKLAEMLFSTTEKAMTWALQS